MLPDILDVGADAYFMVRGNGIADWPNGARRGPLTISDGFVVAFGFALQTTFGVKPIVWAELYASLDLLVGAKPPTLAGFGRAGGSLNLGPFSLGGRGAGQVHRLGRASPISGPRSRAGSSSSSSTSKGP